LRLRIDLQEVKKIYSWRFKKPHILKILDLSNKHVLDKYRNYKKLVIKLAIVFDSTSPHGTHVKQCTLKLSFRRSNIVQGPPWKHSGQKYQI